MRWSLLNAKKVLVWPFVLSKRMAFSFAKDVDLSIVINNAFAIKHCSNSLRDKTTTIKVNLSSRIYKERKAELLDGISAIFVSSERGRKFSIRRRKRQHTTLWKTKERFSYNYMKLREILNFQLTGEKYLMECTTSAHKITRENIPGHVWKCTCAKHWVGNL